MDNILNKTIRILIVAIISIMLTIGAIFIVPPSYAISADDFEVLYKSGSISNTAYQEGFSFFKFNDTRYSSIKLQTELTDLPVYFFTTGSQNNSSIGYVVAVPEDLLSQYPDTDFIYINEPNGGHYHRRSSFTNSYNGYKYYYSGLSYSGSFPVEMYCGFYSSIAEGFEALDEFVNGSSAWSGPVTVTVESGCVAYMLVDGGRADLTCIFPELSNLLSRPLWKSTATYFYSDNLPSSGLYYNSQSGTLIDWLKAAEGDTNLAQQTHMGGRPLTDLPSGQFLVVYNPFYRGFDSNGSGIMSPSITVKLTNCGAVRQYKLTASYSNGDITSTSDDNFQSFYQAIGEEEIGSGIPQYTFYSANGSTSSAISVGSGNNIVTVENEEQTIGGFIQKILNIFSAPITYIRQLYDSAITFFSSLSLFWTWLPEPVYNIIISAVIVLVVIGVIKWLWK